MILFAFDNVNQNSIALTGTWTGISFSFRQIKGPDISAMIEGGKALHIGGKLILKPDFTYLIKDPQGNTNGEGIWKNNDRKSFTTTDSGGEQTTYEILTLDENKLITKHRVATNTPDGEVEGEITLGYKK